MGNIHGRPKQIESRVTTIDTIAKLQKQIQVLELSVKQKTALVSTLKEKARECLRESHESQAKLLLQKKARIEKRLTELTNMIGVLETQIITIESANMNKNIVDATLLTSKTLKSISLDPDTVTTVMDDVRDQINNIDDVSSMLCEPFGSDVDVSDELNDLRSDRVVMPSVPTIQHSTQMEKEISDLENGINRTAIAE